MVGTTVPYPVGWWPDPGQCSRDRHRECAPLGVDVSSGVGETAESCKDHGKDRERIRQCTQILTITEQTNDCYTRVYRVVQWPLLWRLWRQFVPEILVPAMQSWRSPTSRLRPMPVPVGARRPDTDLGRPTPLTRARHRPTRWGAGSTSARSGPCRGTRSTMRWSPALVADEWGNSASWRRPARASTAWRQLPPVRWNASSIWAPPTMEAPGNSTSSV